MIGGWLRNFQNFSNGIDFASRLCKVCKLFARVNKIHTCVHNIVVCEYLMRVTQFKFTQSSRVCNSPGYTLTIYTPLGKPGLKCYTSLMRWTGYFSILCSDHVGKNGPFTFAAHLRLIRGGNLHISFSFIHAIDRDAREKAFKENAGNRNLRNNNIHDCASLKHEPTKISFRDSQSCLAHKPPKILRMRWAMLLVSGTCSNCHGCHQNHVHSPSTKLPFQALPCTLLLMTCYTDS